MNRNTTISENHLKLWYTILINSDFIIISLGKKIVDDLTQKVIFTTFGAIYKLNILGKRGGGLVKNSKNPVDVVCDIQIWIKLAVSLECWV